MPHYAPGRAALPALLLCAAIGLPALLPRGASAQRVQTAEYVVRIGTDLRDVVVTSRLPAGTARVRMDAGQAQHLERDFATFVTVLTASAGGRPIGLTADAEAGWVVSGAAAGPITVRYRVDLAFARAPWPAGNEQAAAAFADALYIVGRALFMVPDAAGPARVRFEVPEGWQISTAWTAVPDAPMTFETGPGLDLTRNALVIGRHPSARLSSGSMDFELALPGSGQEVVTLVEPVLRRVLDAYLRLFPDTPASRYVMAFFPAHADDGESFLRSAAFTSRDPLAAEGTVIWGNFLAHELFHFWNGQRIRGADPRSQWRWVAEGFTEYYANITLAREDLISPALFLKKAERHLGNYLYFMGSPALERRSLVQAGANTTANRFGVYDGGWTAAFCLDGLIREHSNNTRSLDDFMRELWGRFGRTGTAYSLADLDRIADHVAGAPLNGFLSAHTSQVTRLPVSACAARLGLGLATKDYAAEAFIFESSPPSRDQLARRRGVYGSSPR